MRRDGRAEAAVALQERQRGRRKLCTEFALAAGAHRLLSEGGDRSLTARVDEDFKIERGGGGKSVMGARRTAFSLILS